MMFRSKIAVVDGKAMAQKCAKTFVPVQEKLEYDSERENFQLQGNNRPLITQKDFFIQLQ